MSNEEPRCPVCRARFRSSRRCSRCGADLTTLQTVLLLAHALRRKARQAMLDGRPASAPAAAAQEHAATARGRRLLLVARWLERTLPPPRCPGGSGTQTRYHGGETLEGRTITVSEM